MSAETEHSTRLPPPPPPPKKKKKKKKTIRFPGFQKYT